MKKRSITALIAFIFVTTALVLPLVTAAAVTSYKLRLCLEVEDPTGESVDKVPLAGGVYSLYKVASAVKNNSGGYTYTLENAFADSGVTLTGLKFWADNGSYNASLETLASKLADHVNNRTVDAAATKSTDVKGYASFTIDSEDAGLYLAVCAPVDKTFGSDTRTYTPQATLVALPFPAKDGSGWIGSVKIKAKITTPSSDEPKTVDITVKKVWDDSEDHHNAVTAQLLCDGVVDQSYTLNDGNRWTHTWTDLDPDHTWNVKEAEVPAGYTATVDQNGNEYTITNTRTSLTGGQEERITVKKVWKGGSDHPGSVTVQLLRDGEPFREQVLNSGNGWSYTWTTSVSGHTWSVNEPDVPEGYTFDVTWEGNVATVANTFESLTEPTPSPEPTPTPGPTPTPVPTPNPTPVPVPTPTPPGNPDLPQTSQLWWPVPLLAAAGVVLLLIGTVLFVRKEEERGPHE